jgi:hypothetical protein
MRINTMHKTNTQEGVTLLVALLLVGVLLGVSTSLLNITLKQYQLSGIALASEVAFQAANAGMECALYYDFPKTNPGVFEVPGIAGKEQTTVPAITCMGKGPISAINIDNPPYSGDEDGMAISGEEQNFQFEWGTPAVCVDLSIFKFYSTSTSVQRVVDGVDIDVSKPCAQNSVCTVIQSRGYNVDCNTLAAGSNPRIVEREYTQVY